MRLFAAAVALAYGPCAIAQTQAMNTPAPTPMATPQSPAQRPRPGQAARPGAAAAKAKPANVAPSTPVVTLQGVCSAPPAKGVCKTVITREELDDFVKAMEPGASEAARGRLAVQYARSLAFSALAERQGFEKNPVLAKELEVQMKLVRMRILSSAYLQSLQNQAGSVAESDIQKYYDEHRDQYAQAQVRRLAVPFLAPTESGRPLDHGAVKSEMEEMRRRADAGEDFNRLQQEAYKHLHIQAAPPPAGISTVRRNTVQGDEAKALDLKPGEISAVLDLGAAMAIIKLESKEPAPIESVRQEIQAALLRGRIQNEVSDATRKINVQFNLPYLGLSSQPDAFGPGAISPATSPGGAPRTAVGARP
jgi:hypothetical protein